MTLSAAENSADTQLDRIEGVIIAHRKILAELLALLDDPTLEKLAARMNDRAALQDGQEDPGAVPTDGVATGLMIGEETSRILSLTRSRLQENEQEAPLPSATA